MGDWLDAIGLVCGALGTGLLFYFGVPRYPERSRAGQNYLLLESDDEAERDRVLKAHRFGNLGLGLLFGAFAFQFAALVCSGA